MDRQSGHLVAEQHASLKHTVKQSLHGSLIGKTETHALGQNKGFCSQSIRETESVCSDHCSALFSIVLKSILQISVGDNECDITSWLLPGVIICLNLCIQFA